MSEQEGMGMEEEFEDPQQGRSDEEELDEEVTSFEEPPEGDDDSMEGEKQQ